ncbi:Phenazine biosynthesis-like domain-containing protein [Tetrabaena socialis]|uniref:Phenazine biosynthesis-like domain-containing protein n=1 Tax=Tetrabaena socialis TaxID=47790 RepID=A0A2J7ZQA9_9CHLO|nr:Phenazine biosynthesis-like domain-containing protein [Tetrabaena socialis]|eukprot:PNH02455.1 Phenazine biosynthesis-like domain-containing protein [Tetrabaena socialis]
MALRLPMYIVDAFSERPFSGNPAAVCLLPRGVFLSDPVRQRVAAEMNLSETAFLEPMEDATAAQLPDSGGDPFESASVFRLRWFTPTREVPLCGHATLASAAVLFQDSPLAARFLAARGNLHAAISFHTLSGVLVVSSMPPVHTPSLRATLAPAESLPAAAQPMRLSLTLPICDPVDPVPPAAADLAGPLARACAGSLPVAEVRFCGRGGLNYVLFVLGEEVGASELEALQPDFAAMLAAASEEEVTGVIVCVRTPPDTASSSSADPGLRPTLRGPAHPDVCSRFFAPWAGIEEDPVTGSAHAVLGPFWEKALLGARSDGSADQGSGIMWMRQCSRRGGEVQVEVLRSEDRCRVTGAACLVLEGVLRL